MPHNETKDLGPGGTFVRSTTAQLLVLSDSATLGPDWDSEFEDTDGDGIPDHLRVDGTVTALEPGTFLLVGHLNDEDGSLVMSTSTLFELTEPVTDLVVSLYFDGATIYESRMDGPYTISQLELIDVGIGFVLADSAEDVHETEKISWRAFGPPVG